MTPGKMFETIAPIELTVNESIVSPSTKPDESKVVHPEPNETESP
jgi:hypothetical protein